MNPIDVWNNKFVMPELSIGQVNYEPSQWLRGITGEPAKKPTYKEKFKNYRIKKVIISGPATIVFFGDKTKIVVKCSEDETFDLEKALALAIARKALGNKGSYFNFIEEGVKLAEMPDVSD